MMSYSFKNYKLSEQLNILVILVIVKNIIKQFNCVTNTYIPILFLLDGRRKYEAMKDLDCSIFRFYSANKYFVSLIINNNTNILFGMLQTYCFHSNVFTCSVVWFLFLMAINFLKTLVVLHFFCFLFLFAIYYSIFFISLWSAKMWFFLCFFFFL